MSTLSTQINPRSDVFQANEAAMLGEVNKLRELTAAIAQGGVLPNIQAVLLPKKTEKTKAAA